MPKSRPTQSLVDLIREQIVVTLPDMHAVLGPVSHRTVCRKLTQAGCRSSYSHRGRYYTLDEFADFDTHGLWSYGDIHFSRSGTLKATLIDLVERSYGGLFARDLRRMVKLDVLAALSKLTQTGRISRTKIGGHYLYVSKHADIRRQQQRNQRARPLVRGGIFEQASKSLLGVLDEKQRRLYAGLESLRPDSGGDRQVAARLGMARATVTKGRKQLLSEDFETERVRKPGGGRKPAEKKTPNSPHSSHA